MFIDLTDVPADGLTLDRHLTLEDPADGACPVPDGARLVARLTRGRLGVELSGRVEAEVLLECSRCAEPFRTPIVAEVALVIVAEASEFGLGEHRVAPEEAGLFYGQDGRVDLREVVREQIYLNLPLKPICRADCAGLCPTCGADRNRIECACQTVEPDPRLAPLLSLVRRGPVERKGHEPKRAGRRRRGKDHGEPQT